MPEIATATIDLQLCALIDPYHREVSLLWLTFLREDRRGGRVRA